MQQAANAQWAHDIRNTLGTVAIYVDTLSLSGARHADIVASTHALLTKAAAMCDAVVGGDRKARAPRSSRASRLNRGMSALTLDPMERKARPLQDRGANGASP